MSKPLKSGAGPAGTKVQKSRADITLAIAALGVVFGDIGTSPLYTMKPCFDFSGARPVLADILGICSLLVWTLVVVVCIKYVGFIMRVDHDGEGGILALLALASKPARQGVLVSMGALTLIVVVGAAMLFSDGMITPAISVISAVEGIGVVSSALHTWIVPISVVVLIALFSIQARGTEAVGRLFGPTMVAWFVAIGIAGAHGIIARPQILAALDPRNAFAFAQRHGLAGFLVLGGVVLAVTGVEALYADLSHFGRMPIVRAWYCLVFPSLLLAYLGEGAMLMANPHNLESPFYALTPGWTLIPMVLLATLATIIASQALISAAFTLIQQAVALGLWPRMEITHTSRRIIGQVYLPAVAVALAIGCTLLVVTFRSSDRLASAYGLAVSTTMLATSIAYYAVITRVKHWPPIVAVPLVALFVLVDGSFVAAGLPKFLDGAWLPITLSLVFTTISLIWLVGRTHVSEALATQQTPLDAVKSTLPADGEPSGSMVFLTHDANSVPNLVGHPWVSARVREERLILLHITPERKPYVPDAERVVIERLTPRLVRIDAYFGYMEPFRIEPILRSCQSLGLDLEEEGTSLFYADPKLVARPKRGLPRWQRWLFSVLQRNARTLPEELEIPAERCVELGVTVAI
jgi:KUP system potassium uptake protein